MDEIDNNDSQDSKADPIKRSEEISNSPQKPITKPISINRQKSSEQMEVHHHPDLHHKKKNFKEYFLEFLMIFLAVTMGFFAENIREHFSTNEIVMQLTKQMVQELKKDTANLNRSIADQTDLRKKADSVFYMLQKPLDQIDVKKLQHLIVSCFAISPFTPSSGALTSIKNQLNLKQFSRSIISNYITDYDDEKNSVKVFEGIQLQQVLQIIQKFMQEHFSASDLYALRITGTEVSGKLRNVSPDDLDLLRADMVSIEDFNRMSENGYKSCRESALKLKEYVCKEYSLDATIDSREDTLKKE